MAGHVSPKSTYYTIFGTLMALTAVTVFVAFVNLGMLNFPVALTIAIFKATLVVLFFMHVKYSSRLTKLVCGSAFFFLLILFTLTLSDYLSREWYTSPRGTVGAGTQRTIGPPPAGSTGKSFQKRPPRRGVSDFSFRRRAASSRAAVGDRRQHVRCRFPADILPLNDARPHHPRA